MELSKMHFLRKSFEEQLLKVPDGEKKKFEKNLLEKLLFETIVLDEVSNVKVKLPVWSGEFLRKLDLSEVDFSDVSWSLLSDFGVFDDFCEYDFGGIKQVIEGVDERTVNYSYTNANIDLKKSFDFKMLGEIVISNCNFEGMKFANDFGDLSISVIDSNMSKTNMTVNKENTFYFVNSDLSYTDLSLTKLDGVECLFKENDIMYNCNLAYTGANIVFNVEDFKDFIMEECTYGDVYNKYISIFKQLIDSDLVGCYINGHLVHSSLQREIIKEKMKRLYIK